MRTVLRPVGFAILATLSSGALAAGKANPYATATNGDFSVMALITADPGWRNEWNRTDGFAPRLVPSDSVRTGDTAQVLVMFVGATEQAGKVSLICDASIALPDGSVQRLADAPCFQGALGGPREAVRLLEIDMGLHVEPSDALGVYTFTIGVSDAFGKRQVDVDVSVEVQ